MRIPIGPPGAQPPPGKLSGLRTGRLPAIRWVNPRPCPHGRGFSLAESAAREPAVRNAAHLTKVSLLRPRNEAMNRSGMRGRTCHPHGRGSSAGPRQPGVFHVRPTPPRPSERRARKQS